ncbi:CCL4 protein, partial [Picathartes gymnocephalus]|nr:CCL4 protein [Picathartes gymnocephalus]
MKTFTAALAVLFVAVFCYQATSFPISFDFYGPCCVEYMTRPLPLTRVVKYEHTVLYQLFTTIKNKLVCANPNDKWVQNIMNQLKDNEHTG